ncbi:MAG: leucyl/phenylalanyl-tRNA--protein transferase [Cytophagales bacterium]|nr:leucyl/phenylalanyl-tRNA--protein transferase [Cytophagales bacterium]
MPIYQLTNEIIFPPVDGAEEGVVAVGGDLSIERLELAYHSGIFPWYSEGQPIIWWSPDPRFVLFPERLKISKSMKQVLRNHTFEITYNQDFEQVISNCKQITRKGQESTWITSEMRRAYISLHKVGMAKSVEVWSQDELVGGLYGVDLGTIFCGESMFSKVNNASKIAFITFTKEFQRRGGTLIDCQIYTNHLAGMGAEEIPRKKFFEFL